MKSRLLRRLKRRFSSAAPILAIRPHVPWYLRWAIAVPFAFLIGGVIWWAYDSGLEFAGFHRAQAEQELAQLQNRVASLTDENEQLASQITSYERQMQMERAANLQAAQQLREVNEENDRLKEDLMLLQNLTVAGTPEGELSIQNFKVERDTLPGEYRFHMLLVQGSHQRAKAFQGHLQLLVNVVRDGERSVVVFPHEGTIPASIMGDTTYQLNFKYYLRIQRSFQLPEDALIESVEVRVFERGSNEPKTKQSVTPTL